MHLPYILVLLADEKPDDDAYVAGPIGALVFVLLIVAVGLLGRSLSRHLRKAQDAADAGVYDADSPKGPSGTD